jgi:hypothetical protein
VVDAPPVLTAVHCAVVFVRSANVDPEGYEQVREVTSRRPLALTLYVALTKGMPSVGDRV